MKNRIAFLKTPQLVAEAALFPALLVLGCKNSVGGSYTSPIAPGAGTGVGGNGRGPSPVVLGGAGTFVLLAQSAITDVPSSSITGNVGLSPATGTGIGVTCVEVTGTIFSADPAGPACKTTDASGLTTAINDKNTAYTTANGRAPDYVELGAGNIGGLNLGPATYKWGTALLIPTNVILTGGPNDVWIFQVAQGLTMSPGAQITLAGGALAQNIYWAVFSASLDTTTVFKGTLNSQTAIVVKTGATVNGKLLAGTAISLDHVTVAP